MAYTTINKSSDYFNPVEYAGDGTSDRAVTSGFATDFVWIKNRNTTDDHVIFDKVRGGTKYVYTNATQAESTYSSLDLTFESTGVDVGSYTTINNNGSNLISYHWKANGTGSANTNGSINTTYTSANTTAGFSISSYTGTGANATVGHGLGVAPKMYICKSLSSARSWAVYNQNIGNTKALFLNSSDAQDTDATYWNSTSPTNSVVSLGSRSEMNHSGENFVMYCFAEKTGYSKFGSYTGNGNADGTFVYTGFKPAFLIAKETGNTRDWVMVDNKRPGYNVVDELLVPNSSGAEITGNSSLYIDLISNGFKIRGDNSAWNNSGGNYIFMAFAETPLVGSNNVPCTAR